MDIKTKADQRDVIGLSDDISHDALLMVSITEYRHGHQHAAMAWINQDEAVQLVNHLCNVFDI